MRVDQRANSGSEGMAHDLTTGTRSGQFPCQGMGRMGRTTGTGQELTTYEFKLNVHRKNLRFVTYVSIRGIHVVPGDELKTK